MGDIELAVSRCKELESLLEDGFGAQGRGLHEKVTSIEARLSPALVKRLRFIATVRNKIVHEADYKQIDDRDGFADACTRAETELRAMLRPPAKKRLWLTVGLVWLVLVVIAVLLYLLRR